MENERTKVKVPRLQSCDYDELINENTNNTPNETEETIFDRFERLCRIHSPFPIHSVKFLESEMILAIHGVSLLSTTIDEHLQEQTNEELIPTSFGGLVSKYLPNSIYFMDVWKHSERNEPLLICAGANTTLLVIDKYGGVFQMVAQANWITGIFIWKSFILVCGQNTAHPVKVYKVFLKDEQEHKNRLEEFKKNQPLEPLNTSSWGFRKDVAPAPPSLVDKLECVADFAPSGVEGASLSFNDQLWIGGRNCISVWKATLREDDVPIFEPQFRKLQFSDGVVKAFCVWKDVVVSASWNVHVWDSNTGTQIKLLPHKLAVQALAVWGSLLATGSDDHIIRLWNLKYESIAELKGHTGYLRSLSIYKQKYLLSVADDQCVCAWTDRFSWHHVRVLFIGWLKNTPSECPLAMLPKDLFQYILHDLYSNNGRKYRILYDDWAFEDSDS